MPPTERRCAIGAARILVLLVGSSLWITCSGSTPEPLSLPPQTVSQAQPTDAPPDSELPVAAAIKDDTVLVIDEGAPSDAPSTLVEAAAAEKVRRQNEKQPTTVITDKNLKDYATGKLTFSDHTPSAGEPSSADDAETAELLSTEDYWRGRALDARRRWRDAYDRIPELEAEIAGLRRRFYAEDDPFYRDSQIKPAWDKALLDIEVARHDVADAQQDLTRLLDEGHRAGALPGWLREGLELEPDRETEAPAEHSGAEPSEPDTIDNYGTEPPQ